MKRIPLSKFKGLIFFAYKFRKSNPSEKIMLQLFCVVNMCGLVYHFSVISVQLLVEWVSDISIAHRLKFLPLSFLFSAMVFSASLSHNSFSCLTQFPQNFRRNPLRVHLIRAVKSTEPEKKVPETKTQEPPVAEPSSSSSPTASPKVPKKPVYSSEFLLLFCFQSIGNWGFNLDLLISFFICFLCSEEGSDCESWQREVS